jgi:hypothetical protein
MDFITTGFLTIRDAVKRLLSATHGDDWGSREIVLENDATDIPGTWIGQGLTPRLPQGFHPL